MLIVVSHLNTFFYIDWFINCRALNRHITCADLPPPLDTCAFRSDVFLKNSQKMCWLPSITFIHKKHGPKERERHLLGFTILRCHLSRNYLSAYPLVATQSHQISEAKQVRAWSVRSTLEKLANQANGVRVSGLWWLEGLMTQIGSLASLSG